MARKKKYQDCTLKPHQEHALRCNFKMRNTPGKESHYRGMIHRGLKNLLLDRSIARCKGLGPKGE